MASPVEFWTTIKRMTDHAKADLEPWQQGLADDAVAARENGKQVIVSPPRQAR